jgi:hypothetical protein
MPFPLTNSVTSTAVNRDGPRPGPNAFGACPRAVNEGRRPSPRSALSLAESAPKTLSRTLTDNASEANKRSRRQTQCLEPGLGQRKEKIMLALLRDVPVISHPVFRIVLGAALVAVGLLVLRHNYVITAVGALILVMGLVRGVSTLTGRAAKGQPR